MVIQLFLQSSSLFPFFSTSIAFLDFLQRWKQHNLITGHVIILIAKLGVKGRRRPTTGWEVWRPRMLGFTCNTLNTKSIRLNEGFNLTAGSDFRASFFSTPYFSHDPQELIRGQNN